MESSDLLQQSWLILDTLTRRWSPDGGDFAAYVRTAFPWELWRYVRTQSPTRRARAVRVDNVRHDELLERVNDRPGIDGRGWDEQLITAEMLDDLDPLPRRVVLLHLLEDQSFKQVAHALELTSTTAYREYRRALDRLRLQSGQEIDPGEPARGTGRGVHAAERRGQDGGRRALERLIEALHEGAGGDGRLPGRSWIRERTGVSEVRLARLMRLLVDRGCVEGRSARRPGRLVHPSPCDTLERVLRTED